MANQYFENNENLASEIHEIKYYYKGHEMIFYSDNGVFSKGSIDYGSNFLLKTIRIKDAKKILDVGCGYGTIGLSLAHAYPDIEFTLIDVNLRAISLAKKAMETNNIKNAEIFESDIYTNITGTYDIVVSNPPIRAGKEVVHKIILDAYDHLSENGQMWCVIQKKQGAPSAIKALKNKYNTVETVDISAGYYILCAKK